MVQKTRKFIVMGYKGVGKSSFIIRFVDDHFVDTYSPTIENTFHKTLKIRGETYQISILDTAGQDEYSIFQDKHSINVDGFILVYSVTNKTSYKLIETINDKILNGIGSDNVPRVIVATKIDLGGDRRVTQEDGKALSNKLKLPLIECSAKYNENISLPFEALIDRIEIQQGDREEPKDCCIIL